MKHFKEKEFKSWFSNMSLPLLAGLEEFREVLQEQIMVSPAYGAIGRKLGASASQHNIERWGEVRAIDVMFPRTDIAVAYNIARGLELFSGIGVYPDWNPFSGLHLDVRESRTPQQPALWGGLLNDDGEQVYMSVEDVLKNV